MKNKDDKTDHKPSSSFKAANQIKNLYEVANKGSSGIGRQIV